MLPEDHFGLLLKASAYCKGNLCLCVDVRCFVQFKSVKRKKHELDSYLTFLNADSCNLRLTLIYLIFCRFNRACEIYCCVHLHHTAVGGYPQKIDFLKIFYFFLKMVL